jgi:hypothetical protein
VLFVKLFKPGFLMGMDRDMQGGKQLNEVLDPEGKFMRKFYEAD